MVNAPLLPATMNRAVTENDKASVGTSTTNVETLLVAHDKEDKLQLRSVVEVRVLDEEVFKSAAIEQADGDPQPPQNLDLPINASSDSSNCTSPPPAVTPKAPSTLATLTTAGTMASIESNTSVNDDDESSRIRNSNTNSSSDMVTSSNDDAGDPTGSGGGVGAGTDDSYFGSLLGFASSSASLASSSASTNKKKRKKKNKPQARISQSPSSGDLLDDENDQYDDDDDQSVSSSASSAAYFEPSDLNPGYWVRVMGNHAPTFALTLVALSAAVLHPILFVAGTIAAFGTYTAAAAASSSNVGPYDKLCLRYATPSSKKEDDNTEPPVASIFCWNTSDTTDNAGESTSTALVPAPPAIEPLSDSEASESSVPAVQEAVAHSVGVESAPEPFTVRDHERSDEPLTKAPAATSSTSTEAQQREFIEATYPALEHPILKDQVFYGLSALETFKIFFDDHAPYNFIEFQKNRGDVDITYRPWEPVTTNGGPESDASDGFARPEPLLTPKSAPTAVAPPVLAYQQRVVTFKAKTNAIFGPSYAPTTKTQRFVMLSKRWAVLESRTELSDIPFADRFFVMERWIVHATKTHGDGDRPNADDPLSPLSGGPSPPSYVCRISISAQVVFKKPCGALENQIRTKAYSTLLEVATAWCCMAREALNLAEMARLNRLRQHSEQEPLPIDGSGDPSTRSVPVDEILVDESVEVEHSHADGSADDAGVVTLRRSESEPGFYHPHAAQPRFHNLRQSIINFSVRKPSFEFRRPRKGTAAW